MHIMAVIRHLHFSTSLGEITISGDGMNMYTTANTLASYSPIMSIHLALFSVTLEEFTDNHHPHKHRQSKWCGGGSRLRECPEGR
jgi:hypothetical protein